MLAPVAEDHPPLDGGRAAALDQLLGDRPGQGLPRLGAAPGTQPGLAPQDRAQQLVAPEALVEGRQVVVDAEGEAHPLDAGAGRVLARAPRRGSARRRRRPRRAPRRGRRPRAGGGSRPRPRCAARRRGRRPATGRDRRARRPARRCEAQRLSRWTSTRNEREEAMSTPRALASLRARRWASARPVGRAAEHLDQDEGRDAQDEPAGGGGHGGRDARRAAGPRSPRAGCWSAGTGRWRTSATSSPSRASSSGWLSAGSGKEIECNPQVGSSRSYIRYFLTTRPPMPSMPRFMASLVSRIQPISPQVWGVRTAVSKCSM